MENINKAQNPSRNKKRQSPRADFHDYTAPGYYLITITAYPGAPRLSAINMPSEVILRKGGMIIPVNTELGECVRDECNKQILFPQFSGVLIPHPKKAS